jgi:tetratricopeptide (TPR) repeat protein
LAFASGATFLTRRNHPWIAAGWLWYLVTLLPVIGLVKAGGQAIADRYTYMPLTGIFIIWIWGTAWLARRIGRRGRIVLITLFCGFLGMMASLTWRQVQLWKDGRTLFEHALLVTKDNYFAHYSLALAMDAAKQPAEALPHFEAAVRIAPHFYKCRTDYGAALNRRGAYDEAVRQLEQSIASAPAYAPAYFTLGMVYHDHGKDSLALAYYHRAVQLDTACWEAYNNIGFLYARQRLYADAADCFSQVIALRPAEIDAYLNRARARFELKSDSLAFADCHKAAAVHPRDAQLLATVANLLAEYGHTREAVAYYRGAQAIDADNAALSSTLRQMEQRLTVQRQTAPADSAAVGDSISHK